MGEVLGVLTGLGAAADIDIERIPVNAAKFFQSDVGLPRALALGGENDGPTRGDKNVGSGAGWRVGWEIGAQRMERL